MLATDIESGDAPALCERFVAWSGWRWSEFRSRASLEAENTILRHQLNVLRRQSPKRPTFGMLDRLIFAGLYRLAPKVLGALAIVKPETVIKWHRAGFRSYWRWKSRRRGGRPTVAPEIRKLIREMSARREMLRYPAALRALYEGSDLLWRLGEMERRYESARGCRRSSSLNPLIVVRREVQQSSLGKLVCVLRKAATTFGISLQEVGIHGNPPTQQQTQSYTVASTTGVGGCA